MHFSAVQLRTVNRVPGIRISPFSEPSVPQERYYIGLVTRFSPGSLAGTKNGGNNHILAPFLYAKSEGPTDSTKFACCRDENRSAHKRSIKREGNTDSQSSLLVPRSCTLLLINFKNNSQRPAQVSPIMDRPSDRSIA